MLFKKEEKSPEPPKEEKGDTKPLPEVKSLSLEALESRLTALEFKFEHLRTLLLEEDRFTHRTKLSPFGRTFRRKMGIAK